MANFSDHFTQPNYSKAYAKFNHHDGLVYIESEQDKVFWKQLLAQACSLTFKFIPGCSSDGGLAVNLEGAGTARRGKNCLAQLYETACATAIVAIDSDFDFVAANKSAQAKVINANVWVLQTRAYAKESLDFEVATLEDCAIKTQFFIDHDYTVSAFVTRYSQLIHPLLVRYLLLLDSKAPGLMNEHEFHLAITQFNIEAAFFSQDWTSLAAAITPVLQQLECQPAALQAFAANLASKGLTPATSYQFIRGHDWQNKIVDKLFSCLVNRLKKDEMERIKGDFEGKEISDKKGEMDNHFKNSCKLSTMVACCEKKWADPIYQAIVLQVKTALKPATSL